MQANASVASYTNNEDYNNLDKAAMTLIYFSLNFLGHVRSLSVPVELVSPSDKKLTSHFPETMDPTIEESDLSEPDTLLQEIYDLMSLKTARPLYVSNFNFYHNGCSAYRVATWNMEKLTADKISNPGVMEVITRTILENR